MKKFSPYSIAIPTYNRDKFLIRLLNHIDKEFPNEIDVFIRDNCSRDNTVALVNDWIRLHPHRHVNIKSNKENIGIDKNILSVITDCTTKWVKVFGDDDFFLPELVTKINNFFVSDLKDKTRLVFFNYCEITQALDRRITERQILVYEDRYYDVGCNIVTDVAESLPLLSGLLIDRDAFVDSAKRIPSHIAIGGVGFVWALLHMLQNHAAIFYADPFIQWANGEPERGFSWKRTVVSDFLWIVRDLCPTLLIQVKNRTLRNQITPRMRMMAYNKTQYIERGRIILFLLKYYWNIPKFWLESIPRGLSPRWLIQLYNN